MKNMAQCVVKNYCHNKLVLDSLEEGDLISIKEHILFSHWAVYAGKSHNYIIMFLSIYVRQHRIKGRCSLLAYDDDDIGF